MKLTKVDYNTISKHYRRTKLDAYIDEFIGMNVRAVRIEGWEERYVNPSSCMSAFRKALIRKNCSQIVTRLIQNVPYLINMAVEEEEV